MTREQKFIKELTFTAAAIFFVLLLLLVTTQLVNLLGRVAGGRIAMDGLFTLLAVWIIGLTPLILVLIAFISVFTVMNRYWRDGEMAVWRSCGLPVSGWLGPLFKFVLPYTILTFVVTLVIVPWAKGRGDLYSKVVKQREFASLIKEGSFMGNDGGKDVFFVEKFDPATKVVKNVFIRSSSGTSPFEKMMDGSEGAAKAKEALDEVVGKNQHAHGKSLGSQATNESKEASQSRDNPGAAGSHRKEDGKSLAKRFMGAGQKVVVAKSGEILTKPDRNTVRLENGNIYVLDEDGQVDEMSFGSAEFNFPNAEIIELSTPTRRSATFMQLWTSTDPVFKGELMWRLSIPFAALILSFLAVGLSRTDPRQSKNNNIVWGILAFFFYQAGLSYFRGEISKGRMNFWFGLLVVHVVMAFWAWWLIKRLDGGFKLKLGGARKNGFANSTSIANTNADINVDTEPQISKKKANSEVDVESKESSASEPSDGKDGKAP